MYLITLLYLPPYSPELNPKEDIWDEIREKIFKNYALKSIAACSLNSLSCRRALSKRELLDRALVGRDEQSSSPWIARRVKPGKFMAHRASARGPVSRVRAPGRLNRPLATLWPKHSSISGK